jgi:hypothetical protein
MGWLHQSDHAYRHLIERLNRFNDELPVKVKIELIDSEGRIYGSEYEGDQARMVPAPGP